MASEKPQLGEHGGVDATVRLPASRFRDCLPELAAWFLVGVVLMRFLYAEGIADSGTIGLPGNDSFYHLKMAQLLPEIGLPDTFPWLSTTIFAERFVSHHYGFHALLSAGVRVCLALGADDPMQAARWFNCACFGAVLGAFDLLLIAGGVRYRPVWLVIFLLMPVQFFARHMYIRAMCPSLLCMLLITLAILRRRNVMVGVLVFLYTHLYFGSVLYSPLLVGAFVVTGWLGPRSAAPSWKLPVCAFVGWLAGLVIHPYGGWAAVEFLHIQVLGSGIDPDIPVGREWKSYSPIWFFVQMSAATLVVLVATLLVRGWRGPRLDAREAALLVINFAFLALTLKARRFIEYWPIFSVLSCAYLWRPIVDARIAHRSRIGVVTPTAANAPHADRMRGARLVGETPDGASGRRRVLGAVPVMFLVVSLVTVVVAGRLGITDVAAGWPTWCAVLFALALASFVQLDDRATPQTVVRSFAVAALSAVAVVGLFLGVCALAFSRYQTRKWNGEGGWNWWGGFGVVLIALCLFTMWRRRESAVAGSLRPPRRSAIVLFGATLAMIALLGSAGPLLGVQRSQHCKFDLTAVEHALTWLAEHSEPGDVVFTDDWDTFGVYFFHNHRNYYIVGLDPKFTHARDPELWDRYVRVSRGNVPSYISIPDAPGGDGSAPTREHRELVTLDDIATRFAARWALVDADHAALARKLHAASDFSVLTYRSPFKAPNGRPAYLIFRIHPRSTTAGQ